jgi:hypothetical protein
MSVNIDVHAILLLNLPTLLINNIRGLFVVHNYLIINILIIFCFHRSHMAG